MQPYMKLWTGDFLRDTLHMTSSDVGQYILILMAMWNAGGKLPDDNALLCRIIRSNKISTCVREKLTFSDGWVTQTRLSKEVSATRKIGMLRSLAGKASAKSKSLKHMNGQSTQVPTNGQQKVNTHSHSHIDSVLRTDVPSDKKEVFRKGVNMLAAEGMPDRQARSLVGKWRKLCGNDDLALNELLDKAVEADPGVLAEWVGAALSGKSNGKIRMVGSNYIIPPGTDQWDAWHRFFVKLNDPRIYKTGDLTVPSMWPR